MSRVKRGLSHLKRRKRLLKSAEGFQWGRKNTLKLAKTAVLKAGVHAYRGRKQKKHVARRTWHVVINAASRKHNMSYSRLIDGLTKKKIELNRKMLATLAEQHPQIFEKIVASIQ